MATIGRWGSPISASVGGCLSVGLTGWLETTYPCLEPLRIAISGYGLTGALSLNFAGRGKFGGSCPGSDPYVTYSGGQLALVDVWGALRAGVWTSSTTLLCYVQFNGAPAGPSISAYAGPSVLYGVSKAGTSRDLLGCPTTLQATVTVNDDGSLAIA